MDIPFERKEMRLLKQMVDFYEDQLAHESDPDEAEIIYAITARVQDSLETFERMPPKDPT